FVDGLVEADLRGHWSHGVVRVPPYVRALAAGVVNPTPRIEAVRQFGATALVDGDNGHGVVIGQIATDRAVDLAHQFGVGIVAVRNSNHTGMLATHVLRAANRNMIGYFTSNGPAIMAPHGGREPRMGNAPFAYAVPRRTGDPIVLDMASSQVARGKVRMHADRGDPIPEGWAIDERGVPTRDAAAAMRGSMVPMAGYKGYGIAFVTEILASVLPGARLSVEMPRAFLEAGSSMLDSWGSGHLAMAINVEAFADPGEFTTEVDRLVTSMKETPLAEGTDAILVPGEPEWFTRRHRLRDGIPLNATVLSQLDAFAEEIGIEPI
ncbi:MAG: Ldh family oxidoreductase, partial [Acidimicrobiia bacterium]|nr:Ldh family oxidoreductase [Acidimicrobiia bacterium]